MTVCDAQSLVVGLVCRATVGGTFFWVMPAKPWQSIGTAGCMSIPILLLLHVVSEY